MSDEKNGVDVGQTGKVTGKWVVYLSRFIATLGQLFVCGSCYYFFVIAPCWEVNYPVTIPLVKSLLSLIAFSLPYSLDVVTSIVSAGIICAAFYVIALTSMLLPTIPNKSEVGNFRCATEAMWARIYKPRWLFLAFLTSGNYCPLESVSATGVKYFEDGVPNSVALRQLNAKRVFEIVSIAAIILILITLVGVKPPKLFAFILGLFLICANGIVEIFFIVNGTYKREANHG